VRVTGFDHAVVMCADVERSLRWYCDVLGLEPLRVDEWRRGEVFFPSARISAETILDFFPAAPEGRNVDHLCLVMEPTDLSALAQRDDLDVAEGPVPRWGARGMGWSLYVRDPDGLTVELRHYGTSAAG
jgi:catechol 2,3-dioxygenase-like lactoylglutathione lyase family enzyme